MKKRVIGITVLFAIVILVITGVLWYTGCRNVSAEERKGQVVAINELEQLVRSGEETAFFEKADLLQEELRDVEETVYQNRSLLLLCGICVLFLFVVFGYVYFAILRPFDKMKGFAEQIAKGNFEVPIDFERSNYFGAFTWAFDSMRREITKARACEKEAIENNKTVLATLSHDIKTPIASIRAYAEGLEANLDSGPEKRAKYSSVIMKKCDEVANLTNDLFLHSLSDLDKLKLYPEELELGGFVVSVLEELSVERQDIRLLETVSGVMVSADKNRLTQVIENIVNNARKYAKTELEVSVVRSGKQAELHFRDFGPGIPDEDIPFIFDKFYRGKNCGSEQGSGLGLYIVKYVMEQLNGIVRLQKHKDGQEIILTLPVIRVLS
ncbi:MAG: HAMP domain-containing histidine kinase [Lachnospiraceae bacterium]|nr:HAMP domain-containing histidine kinase [Lachnospiraceae bacterium]